MASDTVSPNIGSGQDTQQPALSNNDVTSHAKITLVTHGLSGFGPRNSLLFKAVVVTYLAEREKLNDLGLRLRFDIFERQNKPSAGSGHAFQIDNEATMNTPYPSRASFTNASEIPLGHQHIVTAATDLVNFSAPSLKQIKDTYLDEFATTNPAARALFAHAILEDGSINMSKAATTRGTFGKLHNATINEVLYFVQREVPEIEVEFHWGYTVKDVDFSSPTEPKLKVYKNNDSTTLETFEFDFVHLANGTTREVPVADKIAPKSYTDIPNHKLVGEFLRKKELLDDKDQIKQGVKLGVTGISLSAYDHIPIILQYTNMVRLTKTGGYELDEEVAKKYPGLFTFINKTEGQVTPPRHHFTRAWPGKTSFLTLPQAHAMFLQKDFDWLSFIMPLLRQNVACEIGTMPSHVNRIMTAKARMNDYHRQTLLYRREEVTEIGLIRAGYHALVEGFGFESNPEEAEKELLKIAPLTREGRAGAMMRRAAAFDISRLEVVETKPNNEFFEHWKELQSTFTASPDLVQDMITQLFTAGVALQATSDWKRLRYEATDKIALTEELSTGDKEHTFDAMITPKMIKREADAVLMALRGRVKEVVAGVPEYAKGRYLQTIDGTPIHVTDVGLGGQGSAFIKDNEKTESTVGMQWTDTNDLASSASWAPTAARMLVLVSAMKVRGSESPVQDLLESYKELLPTRAAFIAETASFKQAWDELVDVKCFLDACEKYCLDAPTYRTYAACATSGSERAQCLAEMAEHSPEITTHYNTQRGSLASSWDPINRNDFYRRFVDFTPLEIDRCWDVFFSTKLTKDATE